MVMAEDESGWLNYHLYYHHDPGSAIDGFVRPLVAGLLSADRIDRFFFVRYGLGGPHIRLRLHPRHGASALVAEAAASQAQDFLASRPSTSNLTPQSIRRGNRQLLASDPHETDGSVYPDNSFLAFPFRPEIERYGGTGLWRDSVDFFVLSSATVLEFLRVHGAEPRARHVTLAFQVLAGQALGFARDEEDLIALLRYAVDLWGERMPRAMEKADRVFTEKKRIFDQLFDTGEARARLNEGARRLAWIVRGADRSVHQRIGTSQLHMTANRLGLDNAEEVFLSQILTRLASGRMASGESLGILPAANASPLRDLLPGVLASLSPTKQVL
jgi:lantibiotic biosynthesis dehydratase-like protein